MSANCRRRKNEYGFAIKSVISWKSRKQQVVALSSCESEYISLSFASQKAKFLSQLYADISGKTASVLLYGDNMGAVSL